MKRCSKCGVLKPWTAEFYPRDRSQAAGFAHRCKECDRISRRAATDPARNSERAKRWARENRKRHSANCYVRWQERCEKDLNVRVAHYVRARTRQALRQVGVTEKTFTLIGCSPVELRAHLEGQFKPGMSWENYGAWHVDHRRPLASFDLTDPEQRRQACHYTNLQPLWAADNLSKGCRLAA